MSEKWWERGYPGGPMVAVPGFPRPLYPPDAKGHETSVDGDDVLAYKRTISRAGRWPWQSFDDTYGNSFAHGKAGGNVSDSGVAGVQRQQKIQPTGYIGQETFNALRSIRIPDGLPHAGEPAMDVNAANLIASAYYRFNPKQSSTTRAAALAAAREWLGYVESPAGSNATVFGRWYGMDHQPWCAMFVAYCYEVEAGGSPSFAQGQRYSYVPYIVNDARAGRNGLSVVSSPLPGDLVCFDWQRDGTFDHVGLYDDDAGDGYFLALEGNTSTSDNSNGGQVMQRTRHPSDATIVFVRVAE